MWKYCRSLLRASPGERVQLYTITKNMAHKEKKKFLGGRRAVSGKGREKEGRRDQVRNGGRQREKRLKREIETQRAEIT